MILLDLVARFVCDTAQLDRQISDTERKAGRLGLNISGGMKAGFTALSGAVAGGLALAARGAVEMENVQAQLQASTGMTAEAAKSATEAINAMAAAPGRTVEAVADAYGKVVTDLGLTGEAADATTEKFLSFARASGQDATGAVLAFDDMLDAWGLTAEDANGLMDQLVASHQRYGGSIEDNQAALAAMAPQLRALNGTVDDGIGLLNLFAANGLDAGSAQRALNAAVSKMPPGTTLDDLVGRLGAIEDPAQRAKEAIKVFGARAGVALANAIQPGMTSLGEYRVTAEEAAGATEAARDALDSTMSARIQGLIGQFGSAIRGLGMEFGPVLTGLASMASLGGALAPSIVRVLDGLGVSSAVGEAAGRAGAAIGGKLAAALGVELTAGSLSLGALVTAGLVLSIPATIVLVSSLGDKDLTTGKNGTGAYSGAGGLPVAIAPYVTDDAKKQTAHDLASIGAEGNRAFADAFFGAGGYELQQKLGLTFAQMSLLIKERMRQTGKDVATIISEWSTLDAASGALAGPQGPAAAAGAEVGTSWADAMTAAAVARMQEAKPQMAAAASEAGTAAATGALSEVSSALTSPAWAQSVVHAQQDLGIRAGVALRSKLAVLLPGAFAAVTPAVEQAAHEVGALVPGEIGDAVAQKRSAIKDGFAQLRQLLKHELSPMREAARLEGRLTGELLGDGLKSADPVVRRKAQEVALEAIGRLAELKPGSKAIGRASMRLMASATEEEKPAMRAAINAVKAAAKERLNTLPDVAEDAGHDTGEALAQALLDKAAAVRKAVAGLTSVVEGGMRISSPSKEGPWSRDGGPMAWAQRAGHRIGDSLGLGLQQARAGVARQRDQLVAAADLPAMRTSSWAAQLAGYDGPMSGTLRVELRHHVEGEMPAGTTASGVAGMLNAGVDATGLVLNLRAAAARR